MSDTRLDTLRMIDPVLTSLAQGYNPVNLIGQYLFPTVSVRKQKGRIPIFGKDAFVLRETHRAIRSNSNRIPPMDFETIEFTLQERDLEVAMDYLEESETYNLLKYEQKLTANLLDILALEKEKAIADYAQNPANFDLTMKLELSAGEGYNSSTGESPIDTIKEGIEQVRKSISQSPNTLIIGSDAYQAIISHSAFTSKIQYIGQFQANIRMLKEIFDVRNVRIGKSVSSADGNTFSDIWHDNVIIAYVDMEEKNNRSQYNPSYGYIFQKEGMPEIDSYYENGGKIKVIRATENWGMKVVMADAAYLITGCAPELT
ncbi:MAG: hypothetical protein A2X64_02845 [Ignavibacteria bacterium GWF2_33_9]|nr:MAG: hypothetical protein A2X64_02845 [Ignavibacteria bacterium GWF2_33_9]